MTPYRFAASLLCLICLICLAPVAFSSEQKILTGIVERVNRDDSTVIVRQEQLIRDIHKKLFVRNPRLFGELQVGAKVTVLYDAKDVLLKVSVYKDERYATPASVVREVHDSEEDIVSKMVIAPRVEKQPEADVVEDRNLGIRLVASTVGSRIRNALAEAIRVQRQSSVTGSSTNVNRVRVSIPQVVLASIPSLGLPGFGNLSLPGAPSLPTPGSLSALANLALAKIPDIQPPQVPNIQPPDVAMPEKPDIKVPAPVKPPKIAGPGAVPGLPTGLPAGLRRGGGMRGPRGAAVSDDSSRRRGSNTPAARRGESTSEANQPRSSREERRIIIRNN